MIAARTASLRRILVGVLLALAVLSSPGIAAIGPGPKIPPDVQARMKRYDSRYYVIYTDFPPEQVETLTVRLTSVAEEYNERTKAWGKGVITKKWPLYVMTRQEDFTASGGREVGTAFADRLMVRLVPGYEFELWHMIQHETFHQFMHAVVNENAPGWIDEGFAEYFGESLWTGDGLATDILPPKRLDFIVPRAKAGKLKPFRDFIRIKNTEWVGVDDYDQAFTMILFFLNGEDGKYQKGLMAYIRTTAAGMAPDAAFAKCFGANIDAIQKGYVAWLLALPSNAGDRAYAKAAVMTLTSYLGRAWSQGQKFATFDEFLAAAKDGSLKKHPKQPLPDELLKENLARAEKLKTWSLDVPKTGLPKLVLTLDDGTVFTATFKLRNSLVDEVKMDIKEAVKP